MDYGNRTVTSDRWSNPFPDLILGHSMTIAMRATAFLLFVFTSTASPIYQVTSLGTLGGAWSTAYRISNSGMVAGEALDDKQTRRAFLHNGATMAALPGASESVAAGVNDAGTAAGTTHDAGRSQATVWINGSPAPLPSLGGVDSWATSINNQGHVVGAATNAAGQGRAVVWIGGIPTDLGVGGTWSAAYGIDNTGRVTGYSEVSPGIFRGFVWSQSAGLAILPTFGGWSSYAFDINSAGAVAGHASLPSGYLHAFRFDGNGLLDLGTLGGNASFAYGINRSGNVVGHSWLAGGNVTHAFLYAGGRMLDLNGLLAAGSGWELTEAYGINDAGQIVGAGFYNGQQTAFRLDPVAGPMPPDTTETPEPSTWTMLAAGVALLLGWRRRRAVG